MNIVKLQNELKNVPDQALIGYVQNPTGQVPSYLALSELQRRKEMRNKYEAAKQPETTVADDLKQSAQPSGLAMLAKNPMSGAPSEPGVAGLPVPDQMFSGQGMAAGGIVAFADGGDTSMNLDKLPSLNLNTGEQTTYVDPNTITSVDAQKYIPGDMSLYFNNVLRNAQGKDFIRANPETQGMGTYFENTQRMANNQDRIQPVTRPSGMQEYFKMIQNLGQQKSEGMAQGGEVKGYADGGYVNPGLVGGPVQESLPWYSGVEDWLNRNLDWSGTNKAMREKADKGWPNEVSNPFISGQPRTDIANEYLGLRQKVDTGKGTYQDIERMKQIEGQGIPTPVTPGGGGYVPGQKTQADIQADIDKQRQLAKDKEAAIKNIYAPKGGTTKEGVKSLADYAKEFRDVIGEDPMQKALMSRMEKMDTAAAKQAEQAPWMALAQAGFSMASGKSPYALQNIAAGAMEGVKSYGDAKDKAAQLEEKRFSLMADIAKAKRAEQIAIASKGSDSRDAQLAREQAERLQDKKMAAEMQIHLLDNTFDLRGKEIAAAAKDLPTATERATKIKPLILEHPDYKPRMKALIDKLGDKASEPGSKNYNLYLEGKKAIEDSIYNEIISKPGLGTTGATYNYVPGKGIMPL